jgi:hypothetical protein
MMDEKRLQAIERKLANEGVFHEVDETFLSLTDVRELIAEVRRLRGWDGRETVFHCPNDQELGGRYNKSTLG